MKALIIGGGLIGVTSAYLLRSRGWDVQVIERAAGVGLEASFANGALLTPSMPHPWNSPGSWRVLLRSLVRSDSPLKLRVHAVPSLAGWGLRFLRNSAQASYQQNALHNLRLAMHSREVMQWLRERVQLDYGRVARGTLRIFRDPAALDQAGAIARQLSAEGLAFRMLSVDETVALEPGLAPIASQLRGAIHYAGDEAGDAYRFCVALAGEAARCGVDFLFRTEVRSLEVARGRIDGVVTTRGRLSGDRCVIAAGSHSAPLLKTAGLHLPVQPAKGYSVTLRTDSAPSALSIPVVDDDLHAAVVPLMGVIRAAGTAEFAGYDRSIDPRRVANLLQLVRAVLPTLQFDPAAARPWCGLRPMSADGVPVIGSTPVADLFVNTGHGHLGWTMAAGSAHLLADLMAGAFSPLDPAAFSIARFN